MAVDPSGPDTSGGYSYQLQAGISLAQLEKKVMFREHLEENQ